MVDKATAELRELAVARRERLMREIIEIDIFLRVCDTVHSDQAVISTEPLWKALQEIHGEPAMATSPSSVVESVSRILRASGATLTRKEINQRLSASGVVISSKNLGNILWRSGVIETIERRYWFVGEERPTSAS